jgi:drug/metabolite transporter (DMT)-like permease
VITLLGFRFLIAAALLWIYVLATRAKLPDRRTIFQLLIMGGVGYTAMSSLYLSSVAHDRLSAGMAALLLYTYPAIVVLLAWRFDGYRLTGRQGAAMGLALAGTLLVLVSPGAGTVFTWSGALLALGAAIVYGTYILFGSRVSVKSAPVVVSAFVCTAAAGVFLTYGLVTGQLVAITGAGWAAVAGTAFFATVVGVLLLFAGMERIGPSAASIVSTLEPVSTVALSAVIFGDRLAPWQMAGGLLVLAGIIWLQSPAAKH